MQGIYTDPSGTVYKIVDSRYIDDPSNNFIKVIIEKLIKHKHVRAHCTCLSEAEYILKEVPRIVHEKEGPYGAKIRAFRGHPEYYMVDMGHFINFEYAELSEERRKQLTYSDKFLLRMYPEMIFYDDGDMIMCGLSVFCRMLKGIWPYPVFLCLNVVDRVMEWWCPSGTTTP